MAKRNSIKTWRNKCDKLYQEVAVKNAMACESCGIHKHGNNLCAHHFCPKSLSNALRYDLKNAIILCRGCHFKHHNGDPQIYENFMERKSADWFKHIRAKRREVVSPTLGWYKSQYERLKQTKDSL